MPTPSSTPRPRKAASSTAPKSAPKADEGTAVEAPVIDKPTEPTAPAPAKPAAPAVVAARWIAEPGTHPTTGDTPCRECFPAGPPPGAGTIGCLHGNWVHVAGGG